MKIQLLSDIHLEYYKTYPGLTHFIEPEAPVLVLCGDICYYKHEHFIPFFREASVGFEYVIFVPGNHEYYMKSYVDLNFNTFELADIEMRDNLSKFKNVYFLQKDTVVINNIKFIGTTLWYEKFDKNKLNDIIPTQNCNFILYNKNLMPHPTIIDNINKDQYNWLKEEVKYKEGYYTVVITHYLPSNKCITEEYLKSPNNFLFITNCESLLKSVNYWMYGHTHTGKKFTIDNSLLISNPYGLPREQHRYKNKNNSIISIPSFALM